VAGLQLLSRKIDAITGSSQTAFSKPTTFQVPGYYTSLDPPLTEVGAVVSMVDRGIKPSGATARSALVVGDDPFRTGLLQTELGRHGFQTKVVPPLGDIQSQAKGIGADVIVGVKGETRLPLFEHVPSPTEPSKQYWDAIWKRVPPPNWPDDHGGGATGVPAQNWNWGRQFVPQVQAGGPGGISTKELARVYVDRGNWPVITTFTLLYGPPSVASQSEEDGERR